MSTEASASAKEASEQPSDVQQEEPQVSNEEIAAVTKAETELEEVAGHETEIAASSAVADTTSGPGVANKSPLLEQKDVATGVTRFQDSEEDSVSSGTESQQGGVSRQLPEALVDGIRIAVRDIESQQESGNAMLQVPGRGGPDKHSPVTGVSSSIESSYKTALSGDSGSRTSLESGVAGGVSNSPDSQESPDNGTSSWEAIASPVPPSSAAAGVHQSSQQSPQVVGRENVEEVDNEINESMRNYEQCFRQCACICDCFRPFAGLVRKSKYYWILKLIMLILSISTLCMGLENLEDCAIKPQLPYIFVTMGITAIVLLISNFVLDVRHLWCPNLNRSCFRAIECFTGYGFLMEFGGALILTYHKIPSFDPSSKDYCDKAFYYYAFYMNIVIFVISVIWYFVDSCSENYIVEGYAQF